ncbi:hypothetical protein SAMN05444413_1023 [Roseivivax marinus]|uniref:hypothetical protein n=1 Tax=Roseivivax marinus TaxID=1379903 RepID=UPI0008D7E352|nr:hypothetical protein [Roseivivax marinus]SEK48342.1 hypothetical protein SAMN05444413_1023 [Roseivivax marinus]
MVVALVRHIDTHQLVGFFAAPDLVTMRIEVGDVYQPFDCEYAEIRSGGFFCGNPGRYGVRLPLLELPDPDLCHPETDWPHAFIVFDAAEPTIALEAAMSDPKLVWHPLDDVDGAAENRLRA